MANWNPPLDFRLSFGYVSIDDMRDSKNLEHADYTRLMIYKIAMEATIGAETPDQDTSIMLGIFTALSGSVSPIAGGIIRDLAQGCINDLDNRMKTMLAHSGKTKEALLAEEVQNRLRNGDILEGDVTEKSLKSHIGNSQGYIERANYAKGILEPMAHVSGFKKHYQYWEGLPAQINQWLS